MKWRTISKHYAEQRILFFNHIAQENAQFHNCPRWRNRRKAMHLGSRIC